MQQTNTDKFLSVSTFTRINPSCERVLDTLLLLVIFNTNVTTTVLAQSEFTQVSIVI